MVDDFGIKYVGKEHDLHLKVTLERDYKVTNDWTGNRYIGITLDWDYERRQVHLSMSGYVQKALTQFQHKSTKKNNMRHFHVRESIMAPKNNIPPNNRQHLYSTRKAKNTYNKYTTNSCF